jgi:hypothetical protein
VARANLTAFTAWLARERGLCFGDSGSGPTAPRSAGSGPTAPRSAGSGPTAPRSAGSGPTAPPYDALWRWSVTDLPGFWQAVWDYCGVTSSAPATSVLASRTMPGAQWFPGARLNYAEHVLRNERPGTTALLYCSETTPVTAVAWEALAGQVRVLATRLRELGVRPGDRVVACLPNSPHAVVAMLATTSIGAIWASCSPDFGWRGVIDRFAQLPPKVLFCVDGYRYGGTEYDRTRRQSRLSRARRAMEAGRGCQRVLLRGQPVLRRPHDARGPGISVRQPARSAQSHPGFGPAHRRLSRPPVESAQPTGHRIRRTRHH